MIKMCGEALTLSLKMISEATLNNSVFPNDWKKGIILPVHIYELSSNKFASNIW